MCNHVMIKAIFLCVLCCGREKHLVSKHSHMVDLSNENSGL
jgi:hypothetical protein